MIINSVQVNCHISFGRETINDYWFEEESIDGTTLKAHRKWKDKLSIELSPKTQAEHDAIVNAIQTNGGFVNVTYPDTTNANITRGFWVDSFSYDLEKEKDGEYYYSAIKLDCTEVTGH